MRASLLFAVSIVALVWFDAQAQNPPPYPVVTGKAYKFERITDGVYFATATGSMVTGSNNPVLIGDRDVMVVDTGTTPAAARAFLEDLKLVTNKPVRYVVNTHFHYDHTDGNQVYAGKADIIAHEYVKYAIENLNVLQREPFKTSQLTNVPNRIETLKKQIADEKEPVRRDALEQQLATAQQGWEALKEIKPTPPNITYSKDKVLDLDVLHREPYKTALANTGAQVDSLQKQIANESDPAKRSDLQKLLAAKQADLDELKAIKPTAPTMTYTSKLTLHQGDREIQLIHPGRGHTQGDTIVYLPKERIVCTGDMMESQPAYMGDALFDEWLKTLDAIKEMDFDTVLPGHGVPFHDKALITAFQSLLRDFMSQVTELRKQGLTPEQAAPKVDLTAHKGDFPQIQGVGAEIRGVRRMYEWMDGRTN